MANSELQFEAFSRHLARSELYTITILLCMRELTSTELLNFINRLMQEYSAELIDWLALISTRTRMRNN